LCLSGHRSRWANARAPPFDRKTEPPPESDRALVLDFAAIDPGSLAIVGGKAANLGVLTRAGLPVPPGVCVTTEAYRRVAALAGLDAVVDALSATAQTDLPRLAELAGKARAAMLAAPVPAPVARAVAAGYARLGADAPVAVRSSATAEDLPLRDFAGQRDTYLNIVRTGCRDGCGPTLLGVAVDRQGGRYRATNGIDHRTVRLAVVIQRMVDASWQAFCSRRTRLPDDGRKRSSTPVRTRRGRGVSGAVSPDHFVVDTATGRILERRIGDKRLAIRSKSGAGRPCAATGATEACLADDRFAEALAALGDRVETHHGSPQDTEWALDGNGVFTAHAGATHHDVPRCPVRAAAGRTFTFTSASALRGDSRIGRSPRWDLRVSA
jgi:pyruvate,water dikinase